MLASETLHIERYYTTMEYLLRRYDQVGRQLGLRAGSIEEYEAWKHEVRTRLRCLTGMDTMQPAPLDPEVTERVEGEGYWRERVVIQTEPGVYMPLYVLVPADLRQGERRAAVLTPHGHSSSGKFSPAARADIPAVAGAILKYNYGYAVQLAQAGFVTFAPDARGFGERRERMVQGDDPQFFLSQSCEFLNHMAIPLGQTVTGMWTWDLIRLVDYVRTRPEVDPERVGCAGLSGGGLQTLWLIALDDRVGCAVVSGYFYGFKDSLLEMAQNCSCNYVPGLWSAVDVGDIGALIAPRPLLIETGTLDPLNGPRGMDNVLEQVEITRRAYALFGAADRLYHDVFEAGHAWHGVEAVPWLHCWLGAS